jgi:MerR family transcriptional regulator, heat shock protein HspR
VKRRKGYFSISAVAKMFSVHQQTVRLYEKQGLITPKRSEGNTRLFSEEDIDRLEDIIYLTHELGINLAGVEMVLKLKKQMKNMQKEMNKLFEQTQDQLDQETEHSKQIIQTRAQQLIKIKQEHRVPNPAQSSENIIVPEPDIIVDTDNWEIEYDEER